MVLQHYHKSIGVKSGLRLGWQSRHHVLKDAGVTLSGFTRLEYARKSRENRIRKTRQSVTKRSTRQVEWGFIMRGEVANRHARHYTFGCSRIPYGTLYR